MHPWHSVTVRSFVSDPHTAIEGKPQGEILNPIDARVARAQHTLHMIANEPIEASLSEAGKLSMPAHHDIRAKYVDLKRLEPYWLLRTIVQRLRMSDRFPRRSEAELCSTTED